jgi:hypothetical protein
MVSPDDSDGEPVLLSRSPLLRPFTPLRPASEGMRLRRAATLYASRRDVDVESGRDRGAE